MVDSQYINNMLFNNIAYLPVNKGDSRILNAYSNNHEADVKKCIQMVEQYEKAIRELRVYNLEYIV